MAERGRADGAFAVGDEGDFTAQAAPKVCDVAVVARVHLLVVQAEEQLAEIQQATERILGPNHLVDEVIREWSACLVVRADALQDIFFPAPILQQLGGAFHKVTFHASASKHVELGLATDAVHGVPKLVEERDDLIVLQQGRRRRCWFGEVAHHGSHGVLLGGGHTAHEGEHRCMVVFAFTRKQVKEEVPLEHARVGVVHGVHFHVGVPHRRVLHAQERQGQQFLVQVEQRARRLLHREVLGDLLLPQLVEPLLVALFEIVEVPRTDDGIGSLAHLLALQGSQRLQFLAPALCEFRAQVAQERRDSCGALGHTVVQHEACPVFEPQECSHFTAETKDVLQQGEVRVQALLAAEPLHLLSCLFHLDVTQHGEQVRIPHSHLVPSVVGGG
mmetsp:Transcript_10183/g.25555  ORF Transcript_10183/g.25555 Transcript_10183/m.25555 type:complete len:388 (+) Transcript_10183:286-1449(+)